MALAIRLKGEVGDAVRVIYSKPVEDPSYDMDAEPDYEVLSDGSIVALDIPAHEHYDTPFKIADTLISGGQTGVDRAALDFAIAHGIPHGGWCPLGRKAEDGVIPLHYQLIETKSSGYRQRTRQNIETADATLILNIGGLSGGSFNTRAMAERRGKPVRVVQLDGDDLDAQVPQVLDWLRANKVGVLNIAGPKEGKRPGIYLRALRFLRMLAASGPPLFPGL